MVFQPTFHSNRKWNFSIRLYLHRGIFHIHFLLELQGNTIITVVLTTSITTTVTTTVTTTATTTTTTTDNNIQLYGRKIVFLNKYVTAI